MFTIHIYGIRGKMTLVGQKNCTLQFGIMQLHIPVSLSNIFFVPIS